jgi:hypothetical protein
VETATRANGIERVSEIFGADVGDVCAILLAGQWYVGKLRLWSEERQEYDSGIMSSWTQKTFDFAIEGTQEIICGQTHTIEAVKI